MEGKKELCAFAGAARGILSVHCPCGTDWSCFWHLLASQMHACWPHVLWRARSAYQSRCLMVLSRLSQQCMHWGEFTTAAPADQALLYIVVHAVCSLRACKQKLAEGCRNHELGLAGS